MLTAVFSLSSLFQTEDIQKLQLIPLQRPLITSKHLHEKLIQPENEAVGVSQPMHNYAIATGGAVAVVAVTHNDDDDDANNLATNDTEKTPQASQSPIDLARQQLDSACDSEPLVKDTSIASSKSMKKDIKRTKRLEKKRLKQQLKQQQKLSKKLKKQKNNEKNNNKIENGSKDETNDTSNKPNQTLQSNLKNSSQLFQEPTVPRAKSKSPVNVTFAFDTIENSGDANNHGRNAHSHKDIVQIDNHAGDHSNGLTNERLSTGVYDSLPLIQVEQLVNDVQRSSAAATTAFPIEPHSDQIDGNGNVVANTASALPISCSSSDSIAFIDDSPNARRATSIPIEMHRNLHDGRFITLQPRNIGAQSMIYARKLEKPLPIAFKIPTKRDQFDKSAHILYQSLKESIDHHFERSAHVHNKLCQVCHEFLLVPDAVVKCLTCGLVCHHTCTLPQVNMAVTCNSFVFICFFGKCRRNFTQSRFLLNCELCLR